MDGDIDRALKYTSSCYPSVLQNNENIYFKLRCRKFIEMIRKCTELQSGPSNKRPDTEPNNQNNRHHQQQRHRQRDVIDDIDEDDDVFDQQMELDDHMSNGQHQHRHDDDEHDDDEDVDDWDDDEERMDTEDADNINARYSALLRDTIQYGQELKSEFAGDPRREVKKALEETFALIAYTDARESSLAPLLEVSGRVPVAEELNSAILGEFLSHLLHIFSNVLRSATRDYDFIPDHFKYVSLC